MCEQMGGDPPSLSEALELAHRIEGVRVGRLRPMKVRKGTGEGETYLVPNREAFSN